MTTLNINKPFNIHRSKHKYPQNDQEWGYYLAGLIDADGSFTDVSKHKPNLTICFHIKDISLAYKIKKFIKYGTISKIKNKNACKYVLTHKQGLQRLLLLLQDKIKHVEKYRRYLLLCQYYQIKGQDIFFDSGMTEKFNQDNQDNLKTSKKNCEILQFDAPEGASNVSFQKQFNLLNNYWYHYLNPIYPVQLVLKYQDYWETCLLKLPEKVFVLLLIAFLKDLHRHKLLSILLCNP